MENAGELRGSRRTHEEENLTSYLVSSCYSKGSLKFE